jgi:hypothetical protein
MEFYSTQISMKESDFFEIRKIIRNGQPKKLSIAVEPLGFFEQRDLLQSGEFLVSERARETRISSSCPAVPQ